MRLGFALLILTLSLACSGSKSPAPSPTPTPSQPTPAPTPTPAPSTGGAPAGGSFAGTLAESRLGTGPFTLVLNKTLPNGFDYTGTWQTTIGGTTYRGNVSAAKATTVNSSTFLLDVTYTLVSTEANCNGTTGISFASTLTQNALSDSRYAITWASSACANALKLPTAGSLNLTRQ